MTRTSRFQEAGLYRKEGWYEGEVVGETHLFKM